MTATLPMSEKQLQAAVLELARLLGYRVFHTFDSRRSEPGFPDLCMVRGRRLVFAELKTVRGRVSDAQSEWVHALLFAGSEVFVWRPESWRSGEIEAVLRRA